MLKSYRMLWYCSKQVGHKELVGTIGLVVGLEEEGHLELFGGKVVLVVLEEESGIRLLLGQLVLEHFGCEEGCSNAEENLPTQLCNDLPGSVCYSLLSAMCLSRKRVCEQTLSSKMGFFAKFSSFRIGLCFLRRMVMSLGKSWS